MSNQNDVYVVYAILMGCFSSMSTEFVLQCFMSVCAGCIFHYHVHFISYPGLPSRIICSYHFYIRLKLNISRNLNCLRISKCFVFHFLYIFRKEKLMLDIYQMIFKSVLKVKKKEGNVMLNMHELLIFEKFCMWKACMCVNCKNVCICVWPSLQGHV